MQIFSNSDYGTFFLFNVSDFCELKEITSIEGEASANNRKAKLIFFYEFVIKGEWSGEKLVHFFMKGSCTRELSLLLYIIYPPMLSVLILLISQSVIHKVFDNMGKVYNKFIILTLT